MTADLTAVPHTSELSRTLNLQTLIERRRVTAEVIATPAECAALAKRYAILSVNHIEASVVLKTAGTHLIRLVCSVSAEIVQACGVSLAPVTQTIQEEYDEILTTSPDLMIGEDEMEYDDNSPVELITGDVIDYGEIVAQIVALAVDPFPRAPGVAPVAHIEHAHNPFAALQGLKPKPDGAAND